MTIFTPFAKFLKICSLTFFGVAHTPSLGFHLSAIKSWTPLNHSKGAPFGPPVGKKLQFSHLLPISHSSPDSDPHRPKTAIFIQYAHCLNLFINYYFLIMAIYSSGCYPSATNSWTPWNILFSLFCIIKSVGFLFPNAVRSPRFLGCIGHYQEIWSMCDYCLPIPSLKLFNPSRIKRVNHSSGETWAIPVNSAFADTDNGGEPGAQP